MIENQRIKKIRELLGLSQSDFAHRIGLKQGSYSDVERGRTGVSKAVILEMQRVFNVNIDWIYTGKGEIFLNTNKVNEPQVDYQKVFEVTPKMPGHSIIKVVPIKAQAGYLKNIDNPVYEDQLKKIVLPFEIPKTEIYLGFEVEGESMLPDISEGDIVIGKELPIESDMRLFKDHVFIIILNTGDFLLKRLKKYDNKEKVGYFISDNEGYPNFDINMKDVAKIYYKKMLLKK